MSYRPITDAAQLPPPGLVAETLRFDMKMDVAQSVLATVGRDLSALASDVAAFANASGGVLLIGARENHRAFSPNTSPSTTQPRSVSSRCTTTR